MQEEVTNKTIALVFRTTKLTAETLKKAIQMYLEYQKGKTQNNHGKISVKKLVGQNAGVSSIEVTDNNIKQFEKVAKKYSVDFSIKKDKTVDPPKYMVFFKGRDADAVTAAFREFSAKNLAKEKKPSIRKRLTKAKEQAKRQDLERGEKIKNRDRGLER